MKKLFKLALTLGAIISLTACGTEEEPSSSDTNPPASENNPAPDDGTTNNNNNNDPTKSEAANFVLNIDLAVDPAKDILGDDSAPAAHASIKRAIQGEDDPVLSQIIRTVDAVGGTYEEKDTYCSWTNIATAYDDIADRIIQSCGDFNSAFDMISMFKDYIPSDIQFGQARSVDVHIEVEPGYYMDIPMKFYIDKDDSGFDFGLYYNAMGSEAYMLLSSTNLSGDRVKYSLKTYNLSRADYFGIKLVPTEDSHGDFKMCWNEAEQYYYYYGYNRNVFTPTATGNEYKIPVTLIDNTGDYLSYNSVTGQITNTYGEPLDIFVYDNNDGTVNLKATPASGASNPTGGNATQRWKIVDHCQISEWIEGEYYERLGLDDTPAYTKTGSGSNSFFKAYKDNDNHWRIYRSFGYGGNECFATQDDQGWYMLYDFSRDEVGAADARSCKIGSLDGAEIAIYGGSKATMLKLNAFEGFDEIRAPKEETRLVSVLEVNNVKIDSYYTTKHDVADLYKNGARIFASTNPVDYTQPSQTVGVEVGSRGYKFREFEYNCNSYGATMMLDGGTSNPNYYTSQVIRDYLEDEIGLTLKFGNHNIKEYLDKAQDVIDNSGTYLADFDFYGITQNQLAYEFYLNLANNVYPAINCKAEILSVFE